MPSLWRDTPAPYGPLFLWIGRGVSALTGENIVAAVLCHRLVVLIGVGLIVWATRAWPALRCRRGQRVVAGCGQPAADHASGRGHPQRSADVGSDAGRHRIRVAGPRCLGLAEAADAEADDRLPGWAPIGMLLFGAVLITLSSQVKLPSLLALGSSRRPWPPLGWQPAALLLVGGAMSAVALAVMAVVGWASGLGFGWIFTLGTANVVRSWMSPPTLLALGTGQAGILLRLGDHTTAVLSLTRGIGVLIIAVMVGWLLVAVWRGRLHPVGGLGVALGVTVLLFPVVQPWYLLWAIIPLAAWATRPGFRVAAIVVTIVVGVFGRRPTETVSRCSKSWTPHWPVP
ncbi:putative membrane protein [Mycobacterium xenopi 4042]|uniref:Putative membrane protein n=1 Tax=Mycobacterium xenopi 4042 TaxID=1299334 RepID=X7YPB5_MYCXE|nr:putative membrane protein [Mycobacterium xenopi 4042]